MASNRESIDKYLIRSTKVPSQDVDVLKNSRNEPCPILANTPKLDLIKTDLDADIENKTEFKTEIMAKDKPSFEAKQSQEISGIEIISTIGDISHEFDAKYPNISNISRNNAVNNPTILSSNPSIQPLNPPTVSKKYERFSDIISSDGLVRLHNPNPNEISVGHEIKKIERRKRSLRKKKEAERTLRNNPPITEYFRKKETSICESGKRKSTFTENSEIKKLKVGPSD